MQQLLHLLIVDAAGQASLCQTIDRRWLLPVVACGERERAPLVAARWLFERRLDGVVAGQWLGRIAMDGRSIDWLIAIAAGGQRRPSPFCCGRLDSLAAGTAVLQYQQWAVRAVTKADGIGVAGPFGSIGWIHDARSWVEGTGCNRGSTSTSFRASPNDVVLGLCDGSARVYFKGVAADRATEIRAMAAAARAVPGSFPRTLALEVRADSTRTLLEACPGVPLARLRDAGAAVRVAADIGRLQRLIPGGLPASSAAPLNLDDVFEDADGLLERAGLPRDSATRRAFDDVASLPRGWTPLDLDPANVFADGPAIRYIDLEPRITALPIALPIFARRVGAAGEHLGALRRAYESASGRHVPWQSVDLVAGIVEVVTGWRRVLRNVESGEVSGPLDGVRRAAARRLASAKPLV